MVSWRRGLAVLCAMVALAVIGNSFIFAFERDAGQFIWDYIADPLVIAVLLVVTVVNVIDSLLIRMSGGSHFTQLPRDIVTAWWLSWVSGTCFSTLPRCPPFKTRFQRCGTILSLLS